MQIGNFYRKHENTIWALMMLAIVVLSAGLLFDCYFDANDDIYIKNLLSGNYTGTPESHNIQMLYPVSLMLSLFYRIFGKLQIPVYGLFLCGCHGLCFYLTVKRSVSLCKKTVGKAILAGLVTLLFLGTFFWELIFTQYTVTCTLLAAAAVFRFYTTDRQLSAKAFFKANAGNILLVILAFLIRSEMLLLVLPMICVAGLCKWATEKTMFTRENTVKYFSVFGAILAGLLLGELLNMAAYGGKDWKTFTTYFDNRTELYDFQFIPSYEGNEEFYESIGLSKSEQLLLENYNFGLDEEIDGDTLLKIADYAASLKTEQISFKENLKQSLLDYKYRTLHATDYPCNVIVLVSYVLLILLAYDNKQYSYIWKIPLLGAVRTALWMFILMRGRAPIRITHSLYLVELFILGAMLLEQAAMERVKMQNSKKPVWIKKMGAPLTGMTVLILTLLGLSILPASITKVQAESSLREKANKEIQALEDYAASHADQFYFVDLYSSVSYDHPEVYDEAIPYSAKLLKDTDNSIQNYDIMGGWVSKSPLTSKKFSAFGLDTMETAIFENPKVYVIAKTTTDMQWMVDYYTEKGTLNAVLEEVDAIEVDGEEIFTVYQMRK